eukprot:Nk52_evm1s1413 gene=Nk52_evmTU1s1413
MGNPEYSSSNIEEEASLPLYTNPAKPNSPRAGSNMDEEKTMIGGMIGAGEFLRNKLYSLKKIPNVKDMEKATFMGANRIDSLDFIRALSHLWVISHHSVYGLAGFLKLPQFLYFFNGHELSWYASGHWAVDGFFMLSGILHTLHLLDSFDRGGSFLSIYGRFIGKRIARLWPMLILAVLFHVVVPIGKPFDSHMDRVNFSDYSSLLLLFPSMPYYLGISDPSPGKHAYTMLYAWTIGTEMQFYLVIPFFAFLIHLCKHRILKLLVPVVISAAMHGLYFIILEKKGLLDSRNYPPCYYDMDLKGCKISQIGYYTEYVTLYARFCSFGFGIIAAVLYRHFRKWMYLLFWNGILTIVVLYGSFYNFHRIVLKERWKLPRDFYEDRTFLAPTRNGLIDSNMYSRLRYDITPFLACIAILSIVGARGTSLNGILNYIFGNAVVKTISDLSYTNYFVHCYFIVWMYEVFVPRKHLRHSQFCVMLFFNIILSLATSYIIHRFYEKPFAYFLRKRVLRISSAKKYPHVEDKDFEEEDHNSEKTIHPSIAAV